MIDLLSISSFPFFGWDSWGTTRFSHLPERPDLLGRKSGLNTDHLASEMGFYHSIVNPIISCSIKEEKTLGVHRTPVWSKLKDHKGEYT